MYTVWLVGHESLKLPPEVLSHILRWVLSFIYCAKQSFLVDYWATETFARNTQGAKDILSTELVTLKAKQFTLPDIKTTKTTVVTAKDSLTHRWDWENNFFKKHKVPEIFYPNMCLLVGRRVQTCYIILRKHTGHFPDPVSRRQLFRAFWRKSAAEVF